MEPHTSSVAFLSRYPEHLFFFCGEFRIEFRLNITYSKPIFPVAKNIYFVEITEIMILIITITNISILKRNKFAFIIIEIIMNRY